MRHQIRWTSRKIAARLGELEPLVYRRHQPIDPFRFRKPASPLDPPPIEQKVDESAWEEIKHFSYWGLPRTNFDLRTQFNVQPHGWVLDPLPYSCQLASPEISRIPRHWPISMGNPSQPAIGTIKRSFCPQIGVMEMTTPWLSTVGQALAAASTVIIASAWQRPKIRSIGSVTA